MLSAGEARFESKFRNDINYYENLIDKNIRETTERGNYGCMFSIDCDVSSIVKNKIIEDLNALGYIVSLIKADQRENFYDRINIDWEKERR